MTFDFEGFSITDFIHYIYFPILILEKELDYREEAVYITSSVLNTLYDVVVSVWLSIKTKT